MYKNDRQVTLISGPNGPGDQDVWMSGYLDGTCDIVEPPIGKPGGALAGPPACTGKISYLGGHAYATGTPMSDNGQSQGARLFLNALFEADCVTSVSQPSFTLGLTPLVVAAQTVPVEADLSASYANGGAGPALDGVLMQQVDGAATLVSASGGTIAGVLASWDVGSISGFPAHAGDPGDSGSRASRVRFPDYGTYTFTLALEYRVGVSTLDTPPQTFTVEVKLDSDGDGIPDDDEGGDGGDGGGDPEGGCCDGGGGSGSALAAGLLALVTLLTVAGRGRRKRARWMRAGCAPAR
jgi:hypothetical protein